MNNISTDLGDVLYHMPILWCIAPVQYRKQYKKFRNKSEINLDGVTKYNVKEIADQNVILSTIINCLIATNECLMFSYSKHHKLGLLKDGKKLIGINNKKYFQCIGFELVQSFLLRKIIKDKGCFDMLIKKLSKNVLDIDNIHSTEANNIAYNVCDFFVTLIKDGLILLYINQSKKFLQIILLLNLCIATYEHHPHTYYFLNLFNYILIFTSSTQRKLIREKLEITYIGRDIFQSGNLLSFCIFLKSFTIMRNCVSIIF